MAFLRADEAELNQLAIPPAAKKKSEPPIQLPIAAEIGLR
jgi:hypothetical protein